MLEARGVTKGSWPDSKPECEVTLYALKASRQPDNYIF